ncbi:hypothetical protein GCK32_022290, partial [Trichostrongylus colubriformis]
VLFSFADDPPEVIVPLLHAKFPQYNLTGRTVTGNLSIFEWKALFTILHMTLPITPVYICILILRKAIVKHLVTAVMSSKTRNLHQQLLTALTWQALLPLFYLVAVLSYACGQFGIYNHPLLEHSTFIVGGFIPVLSPLSSLYFVRHYRDRIRWVFLRRSSLLQETNSRDFSTLRESHSFRRPTQ